MSRFARVTSIDVLPLLSAALQKFRAEGVNAIDDLEIELRRAIEWIHHDRKEFWMHELHRSQEALNQARLQLQQAKMIKRVGDHEPACSDEKRALEKAKRRVETAHWKVEAVRHWSGVIDKAVDDFRRARTQFGLWLEVDLSRAAADLNELSESLVNYISMKTPMEGDDPDLVGEETKENEEGTGTEAAGETNQTGTEEVGGNNPAIIDRHSRQVPPSPLTRERLPSDPSERTETGA